MNKTIRVVISGKVQDVGYRAWAVMNASRMGLKGWVRNRSDSTVEALFDGEEAIVLQMIEACKNGPIAARVDKIESYASDEVPDDGPFAARLTV